MLCVLTREIVLDRLRPGLGPSLTLRLPGGRSHRHDLACFPEGAPSPPGGGRRRWSEDCPVVSRPKARIRRRRSSQIFPQILEEWVPDLPLCRLRAVLDLGQELRLDPDAPVSDPLRIRLSLADQGFQ